MESDKQKQYPSLALMLPMEVKTVESYVTWLEELASHVEKSALSKTNSLGDYIKMILEEQKAQLNEDGSEDEECDWVDNIGFAAVKLNVAAMCAYVGDFESAMGHLEILKSERLEKLNLTESHKQVIIYFRDSLLWAVGVLKGLEEDKKKGTKYSFLIRGSSKLQCRWEDLTEDDENKQIKATLAFLKACLSAAMKVSEEVTLNLLFEATNLDPDCFIWFHYAYRIARRIRRNLKRNNKSTLRRPSEDEEGLAKRAFKLRPNDVVTITDYALMLKETLWMENALVWEEHEDDYLKCVELFERASRLANETGNKKWTRKINVYLAEFLAFGKGTKLDQDSGKQMFDELAIEYPNSTFVMHKVGKLYHHGLNRIGDHDGKCIDLNRAKKCYLQAITNNPGNYACLMDYLKLLARLKQYKEMIAAINKALEFYKRDYQVAKLKIAKGYITWIWNPFHLPDRESVAIESWMFVLKNLPEFSKDVYYTNDPIYFDREHPAHVVRNEVMQYLEGVRKGEMGRTDDKEMLLYETFIEEISKFVNRGRNPKTNRSNLHKSQESGDRIKELTEKMGELNVFPRASHHQGGRGRTWRNKCEAEASGDKKEEFGCQPRYPTTEERRAWRKRD